MRGVGAMLSDLGGNEDSVAAFKAALGKKVSALRIDDEANGGDGALVFGFDDGSGLLLQDDGRSCCESRYMKTDDDLGAFVGSVLLGAEVRPGPTEKSEWDDEHETAFLIVSTDRGEFTVVTHNQHNGYYGGFAIRASTP